MFRKAAALMGMAMALGAAVPAQAQNLNEIGRQLQEQVLGGRPTPNPDAERRAYEQGRRDAEQARREDGRNDWRREEVRRNEEARQRDYDLRRREEDRRERAVDVQRRERDIDRQREDRRTWSDEQRTRQDSGRW